MLSRQEEWDNDTDNDSVNFFFFFNCCRRSTVIGGLHSDLFGDASQERDKDDVLASGPCRWQLPHDHRAVGVGCKQALGVWRESEAATMETNR